MPMTRQGWRRRTVLVPLTAVLATVGAMIGLSQTAACASSGLPAAGGAAGALPVGTRFYLDPYSAVAYWAGANPDSPYEPAIAARIGTVPSAVWFTKYDPALITGEVSAVTTAAAAQGTVPVLVLYDIPIVNCTSNAPDAAPSVAAYESWAQNFAAGLGAGYRVIVIVEPDGLALQTCLNPQQAAQRDAAIAFAGRAVHRADPQARVYFDAGNSAWNPASVQARRLAAADVAGSADGIFSNVSNFRGTRDELAYDKDILSDLGDPANLHIVVDTSRNGNGPGGTWCDPSGRAIGALPTVETGDPLVDAYLWIKDPGQADGCADPAGVFDPVLAYDLVANGPGGAGPYTARFGDTPRPSAPAAAAAASSGPSAVSGEPLQAASSTEHCGSPNGARR